MKYLNPYDVPRGWAYLLKSLDKEIQDVIAEGGITNYQVDELKEKYGSLRLYDSFDSDDDKQKEKLHDLNIIYSAISEHTCVCCGTYGVRILKHGWIMPICKSCYENREEEPPMPYEEATAEFDENDLKECKISKYVNDGSKINKITLTYQLEPYVEKIEALKRP